MIIDDINIDADSWNYHFNLINDLIKEQTTLRKKEGYILYNVQIVPPTQTYVERITSSAFSGEKKKKQEHKVIAGKALLFFKQTPLHEALNE